MPTTISTTSGISVNRLSPVEIRTDWDKSAKTSVLKDVGPDAELIDAQKGFSESEKEFWVYSDGNAENIKRAIENDSKKQAALYIYALQRINSEISNKNIVKNNETLMNTVAEKVGLSSVDLLEIKLKAATDYIFEKEPSAFEKVASENKLLIAEFLVNRCDDCRLKLILKFKHLMQNDREQLRSFVKLASATISDPVIINNFRDISKFYQNPANAEKDYPVSISLLEK